MHRKSVGSDGPDRLGAPTRMPDLAEAIEEAANEHHERDRRRAEQAPGA